MLNLGKKLKNVSRTKLLALAGMVMLLTITSGVVTYELIVRPNVASDRQDAKNHNDNIATNEKTILSKDHTANKPLPGIKKTSDTDKADVPANVPADQPDTPQPSRPAGSPELTLPADEDYTLVASSTSVVLGTSEAHPRSVVVRIRYRSGKNIEFLQVAKQPRFEVSSAVYVGSIFVGETSAGTDAVGSRTLSISQLVSDAPAVSGTVYVTTNPNSPPVAIHISWNSAN